MEPGGSILGSEPAAVEGELNQDIPMRPGMQCLLKLLRGASADCLNQQAEWEQALALAEEEHILPWAAHLCARQISVAPHLRSRLSAIQRDAAIAAFYWSSQLKGILRAFDQQGIAVVPLKGPFLAERLYADAALRVNHDLDLLVSKNDLARAEALLSALEFIPDTPDDYHRQWYRGRTTVELHHDVENPLAFNFHTASVLARAQPADFQGQRCWKLAPDDELLFLCLHGVRHRFERLTLILDLCLAFQKLDLPETAPPQPQLAERAILLTLGLAMARCLQPSNAAPPFLGASPAQLRHLDSLADRLWHRLLTQPSNPLDWRALHSFYLEIELPGRRLHRRLRHLKILLYRAIKPDYEFAASFGFHRLWQVRLLRPLRLLRDTLWHSAAWRNSPPG